MKRQYKIYYICLCLFVISAFVFAYKFLEVKDVSQEQIKNAITESTDVKNMNEDTGKAFRNLYGLNKRDFEQFLYYSPKSNMEANEILILKTKSDEQNKSVQETIEARIDKQSDSFKNYNKEQYEILKNHILESRNGYIILIVSEDSDKIQKAIQELF